MQYFSQFPNATTTDYAGNSISIKNILERVDIIPSIRNNPMLFYAYDIQDGDTPDIISNKYYKDPNRYWIVLYGAQVMDPIADWPMPSNLFNDYLVDKYTSATANSLNINANTVTPSQVLAYTQSTIYQYIKTVTTTDSVSNSSNTINYSIDQVAYNKVIQGTQTVTFNTGYTSTITTQAYPQYLYDYEVMTNEAKRSISLINVSYAGALEQQLTNLLGNT